MQQLSLEVAVDQIRQACSDSKDAGRSPFFFLVGAGISYPPIPLASEIIEHCKAEAKKYSRTTEPPGKQAMDSYSHWFQQAFPQPIQRQRYLRNLIEGKPVSDANFRLAHLVLGKKITNLVVTPNFDDFLSKALNLFGMPHIVCDHPSTAGRIDPEQNDIQIINVHGTYWFYDCCNLKGEIEGRSQTSPHTTMTTAALLDRILSRHSPLVIGYSGWEGDVIMTALRRRLQSPLPYNLYWFCYRRTDVDSLPEWLKSNQQVYFVVPPQPEPSPPAVDGLVQGKSWEKEQMMAFTPAEAKDFSGKESKQPVLSAQQVLDRLIQILGLEAPELTTDPFGFYAKHLRGSLLVDDASEGELDIYFIKSVIERIERAKHIEATTIKEIELQVEKVRDAMRASQYREAVKLADGIDKNGLTETQLCELMDTMLSAALKLNDGPDDQLNCYNLAIVIGNKLLQNNNNLSLRENVAKALFNKGVTLGTLNRNDEAIAVYDDVVNRFGGATEPVLREQVAKALFKKGVRLGVLNRNDEAIAVYDDVVNRFGQATEPALREQVAWALFNKGVTLGTLNRNDEAIAVYDDVVNRFGGATGPALHEPVARALFNKGVTLGTLNRNDEAIAVYDDVVKRFGQATEPVLRDGVAGALFNKGVTLGILNRNDDEIAVYDDVVNRFGGATEPELREPVARALVNKGIALGILNRNDDEIAVYDDVVKRFGQATEPELHEIVKNARRNKKEVTQKFDEKSKDRATRKKSIKGKSKK